MNIVPAFTLIAPRRAILGLPVFDLPWDGALSFVNELASLPDGQTQIAFLNANNANIMLADAEYREVLDRQVVLPDGFGIDLASGVLHGRTFTANLNGTDFVPALLTYMESRKRVGLIGGRKAVLAAATEQFRKHAPWHDFIEISDGFFSEGETADVLDRIEKADLDILLVGMGTPLQEKWMAHTIRPEHARLVIGVGALFDFISGTVPRAPNWVRRFRCEWLYRLTREPDRLWRRYLIGIPVFLTYIVLFRLGLRKAADPAPVVTVAPSRPTAVNDGRRSLNLPRQKLRRSSVR
ncbi:WecB/TagA/CpsF family glycosyltransferase [Agrobacterium sp. a22-2]|uniref:WecB/TagA/CpsF family glycosyltransferase n=1 Tax=Agrobacterium sp. a22-2 TaxID=2283840 RepID=UPI001444D431|nr:WecB/TagA/CpsF family glycosyltransferase [Agrobacterium sp. a22-2]NKN34801.1 WecB/TagA/CpsF family glycosyltransferase [Agrobacterium sp. a22-2]